MCTLCNSLDTSKIDAFGSRLLNTLNEAFDFIVTFDAIHDQARPDLVLANIARALRPEGV